MPISRKAVIITESRKIKILPLTKIELLFDQSGA